jgi:primase-polymerase (primpol)-like protein
VSSNLAGGVRKPGIEVYGSARYVITTGDVLRDLPIAPHQADLDKLVAMLGGLEGGGDLPGVPASVPDPRTPEQLIERMRTSRNGANFSALFDQIPQAGGDWSRLDAALAQIIAFHTDDHELAIEVFARSALWRGAGSGTRKAGYENPARYAREYVRRLTFGRAWRLRAKQRAEAWARIEAATTPSGR